jgi:predicted nucleic acid-binding protein
MIKSYLDTNIFIEYLLREMKKKNTDTDCCKIIKKGIKGDFTIYLSDYTLIEIAQFFTDYFLAIRCLEDGYGHREFNIMRRNYTLNDEETEIITSMIETLRTSSYMSYIETEEIKGDYYKIIMSYVKEYLEFIDALHLRTAIDVNCDYFITRDGELRKRAQSIIDRKIIEYPINISTPSSFLKELRLKRNIE